MTGPGRPPNPPPREFYVRCPKCQGKVFLVMTTDRYLMNEDLICLACGAPFVIRKSKRRPKAARSTNARADR